MKLARFLLSSALGLGLAFAITACVAQQNEGAAVAAPLSGNWKVTSLAGVALPDTASVTLEFAPGAVSGSSGCNRYNGSFTQAGNALTFGPAAMTRKACAPQLMDIEAGFSQALAAVTRFDFAGNVLRLYVGDQLIMQAAQG